MGLKFHDGRKNVIEITSVYQVASEEHKAMHRAQLVLEKTRELLDEVYSGKLKLSDLPAAKENLKLSEEEEKNIPDLFQKITFKQYHKESCDDNYSVPEKNPVTRIEWGSNYVDGDDVAKIDAMFPGDAYSNNYSLEEFIRKFEEFIVGKPVCENTPPDLAFQNEYNQMKTGDILIKIIRQLARISEGEYANLYCELEVLVDE